MPRDAKDDESVSDLCFDPAAVIQMLENQHPLLSEFLGYWCPIGDRQAYFFNSQFDYIADYSEFQPDP